MEVKSGIYSITNSVNGKIYIGSSVCLKRRFTTHLFFLRLGKHQENMQVDYDSHGKDSFVFTVIQPVLQKEGETRPDFKKRLLIEEQKHLDRIFATPENVYNLWVKSDTPLGSTLSKNHKAKIKATLKTRYENQSGNRKGCDPWNKGKKVGENPKLRQTLKEKYAAGATSWNKGVKFSDETKDKIRQKALGRKMSQETRDKISATFAKKREQKNN